MTREEILSMPVGRELDELVATKIMKYKLLSENFKQPIYEKEDGAVSVIPHFSTDISAAWEVMEKMSMGKTECVFDLQLRYKGFWAIFDLEGNKVHSGQQKTAPEAISKAALLAVMEC